MRKTLIVGLLVLLCWIGTTLSGQAMGDRRLESRVSRLESGLSRVQSQLTQLGSRLANSQLGEITPLNTGSPSLNDPPLDVQFDNLATLAIELKQQVRSLEERVNQLENAQTSTTISP
ncbi:MAG: hypothetical protein AAFX01_06975 [Cyanobacteria bacterium J06638_28]